MENKWIITSVNEIVPREDGMNVIHFTAQNETTLEEKDFYSSMGTYEIGDIFYPSNEE